MENEPDFREMNDVTLAAAGTLLTEGRQYEGIQEEKDEWIREAKERLENDIITIPSLVEGFVEEGSNWHYDVYDSYTEVGMENKSDFDAFIVRIGKENIEYEIQSLTTDPEHVVHVFE